MGGGLRAAGKLAEAQARAREAIGIYREIEAAAVDVAEAEFELAQILVAAGSVAGREQARTLVGQALARLDDESLKPVSTKIERWRDDNLGP